MVIFQSENNKIPTGNSLGCIQIRTRNSSNSGRKMHRKSKESVPENKSFPIRISFFHTMGFDQIPTLDYCATFLCKILTRIRLFSNPKNALFRPRDFKLFSCGLDQLLMTVDYSFQFSWAEHSMKSAGDGSKGSFDLFLFLPILGLIPIASTIFIVFGAFSTASACWRAKVKSFKFIEFWLQK